MDTMRYVKKLISLCMVGVILLEGSKSLLPLSVKAEEVSGMESYTDAGRQGDISGSAMESMLAGQADSSGNAVEKTYTVTFLTNTGGSTARLEALALRDLKKGEKITLPKLPVYPGYRALGWTIVRGGKTVTGKEGQSFTVQGNTVFYQLNAKIIKASFYNNNGKKEFLSLAKTAIKASDIRLPAPPPLAHYKVLGWARKKGQSKPDYKVGASIHFSSNRVYYAVYKKVATYNVEFYSNDGKSLFKTMTIKADAGSEIKFPELPVKKGYKAVGWAMEPKADGSLVKKPGSRLVLKENIKLYGCWAKGFQIRFMTNRGGSEYQVLRTVKKGGSYLLLESALSPEGYQFLGWSKQKGKQSRPDYLPGYYFKVERDTVLYAVMTKTPISGPDIKNLTRSKNYKTVFFIGDSRTRDMQFEVEKSQGSSRNIQFLCKHKQGLAWFRENENAFIDKIKSVPGKKAIVFNLGINDLHYSANPQVLKETEARYIQTMRHFAAVLSSENCTFYFESVNPVNERECISSSPRYGGISYGVRTPAWVKDFNIKVRTESGYRYINTNHYLSASGYEMVDGLHYSKETTRKIFKKVMESLS